MGLGISANSTLDVIPRTLKGPATNWFMNIIEELDPTLAVVLGRPRLGIKICSARIALCSKRQSAKEPSEIDQISANVRTTRVSAPKKRGVPG